MCNGGSNGDSEDRVSGCMFSTERGAWQAVKVLPASLIPDSPGSLGRRGWPPTLLPPDGKSGILASSDSGCCEWLCFPLLPPDGKSGILAVSDSGCCEWLCFPLLPPDGKSGILAISDSGCCEWLCFLWYTFIVCSPLHNKYEALVGTRYRVRSVAPK